MKIEQKNMSSMLHSMEDENSFSDGSGGGGKQLVCAYSCILVGERGRGKSRDSFLSSSLTVMCVCVFSFWGH